MDFETLLKKISYIEAELKLIKDELVRLIRGTKTMKRMRITNKFKFIRTITIAIFLLIAIFNFSIAKSNQEEAEIIDYTISKGQTLWSIAKEYTPDSKDIRQTIYEIKQLNNMSDSTVYENQTIKIKIGQ